MGMALYVCLMVYTGLSLFIIRRANVYLVVCVLTCITLQFVPIKGFFFYFIQMFTNALRLIVQGTDIPVQKHRPFQAGACIIKRGVA